MRWNSLMSHRHTLLLLLPLAMALLLVACSAPEPTATPPTPTATPTGNVEYAAQTESYSVKIEIGPVVTMPPSAMMTMAMAMMDQGQPVNHHFEVHVFDKTTGAVVRDAVPEVTIADRATGGFRGVPNVMACMTLRHRDIAPHFGDNLFLADGTYNVTVGINSETTVFQNIAVKAAGSPAM